MGQGTAAVDKGYRGMGMEGSIARWYARNTARGMAEFYAAARAVAAQLAEGARVLEVAPGPGYLAIELAKLGPFQVVGLDISETFVRIATENARNAGAAVTFRQGNASLMPFEAAAFDFIVCRAAFKNFSQPVRALEEMYRVLKPGAKAVIMDLRRDASMAEIRSHVATMGLGPVNALLTNLAFKHVLLKRAYSREDFRRMAAETSFKTCEIKEDSIGFLVSLKK
jgi:ubiquinone/menaquinone biosynthesis C-methylase UbiE